MKSKPEAYYKQWLRKAREDEHIGEGVLEEGEFPTGACFHFQQMAEKYLKGLLVFNEQVFPKTHDLFELETILKVSDPTIIDLHEDVEILNRFSVEIRYPGDYPEVSLSEAKEAYDAALRIKDFILQKIKEKQTGG